MQFNLNANEVMVLLSCIHKSLNGSIPDRQVLSMVEQKLSSYVIDVLTKQENKVVHQKLNNWVESQERKLDDLVKGIGQRDENKQILTTDEDDTQRVYPKKPPRMPKLGRKARRRR